MVDERTVGGGTDRRGRRAPYACSFCRKRKMKCDNASPRCGNCVAHNKECVTLLLNKRPRPSNAKISALERDVGRLQRFIQRLKLASESERSDLLEGWTPCGSDRGETPSNDAQNSSDDQSLDGESYDDQDESASHLVVGENGEATYHGPTSVLFAQPSGEVSAEESHTPSNYYRYQLTAAAAEQRNNRTQGLIEWLICAGQREQINVVSDKYDFDGVPRDLALHLLDLHWNRQHHAFLLTYRPAFMRDMACDGPYFSKLLLNAIFFGAAKFSDRVELRSDPDDPASSCSGHVFFQRVKSLLGEAMDRSRITTIQSLLLMASSLFALGSQETAWLYSGLAFRMIIDLGLHVDAINHVKQNQLSVEDVEIRRRVFWGAYVFDKIHSLYQGRPASLQESDMHVPTDFMDTYEELEHWVPHAYLVGPGPQSYKGSPVSTFTQLTKLARIMNRIINDLYATHSSFISQKRHLSRLRRLDESLTVWETELPPHLRFYPNAGEDSIVPTPHVLSLHAVYCVLIIVLHRPFVSDGHLRKSGKSIAWESWQRCIQAAVNLSNILASYRRAFTLKRAPYLISYANYVAATVHVRTAAQKGCNSEAYKLLQFGLRFFEENQVTNPAVFKGARVIRNLMHQMGLTEETIGTPREAAAQPEPIPDPSTITPDTEALDIDAIIQSFRQDQMNASLDANEGHAGNLLWFDGAQDMLFGFMSNDYVGTG